MANEKGSSKSVKDVLKSELYFPSFRNLVHEHDLNNYRYWKQLRGAWVPALTWCFIAEITDDENSQIPFLRNRVLVRDRRGQEDVPIFFYPVSGFFDFKTLKRGHTILVMMAKQHYFLDGSIGLRIENLDSTKVLPCEMSELFELSTFYSQHQSTCWKCEKRTSSEDASVVELKKCSACHVAEYCCKDCQVKDWKDRHKRWCKALPDLLKLAKIDYTKYDEHLARFGFK